jgi:hypothetical protein
MLLSIFDPTKEIKKRKKEKIYKKKIQNTR